MRPEKKSNNDIWDWQVKRGEMKLLKDNLDDLDKEIADTVYREGYSNQLLQDELNKSKTLRADIDSLIEFYEGEIDSTIDYDEALNRLAKLKESKKIRVVNGRKIIIVIEGRLEIEPIKKCLYTADNHVKFSRLFPCTDSRIASTGELAYPDLHGDEMLFSATIRSDIVTWLHYIEA